MESQVPHDEISVFSLVVEINYEVGTKFKIDRASVDRSCVQERER